MNLKDQLLDMKDTSLDDLLSRFNLRRAPRGASRFALPALALAGAAAVGWLARVLHANAPSARPIQRGPSRGRASVQPSATKAVKKTVSNGRLGHRPKPAGAAAR
jgi:anti-sigma factor RsiW